MSLREEGQEIARKLGGEVIYKGPWLPNGEKGEFYGHWFADRVTGSSFTAKTLEEAKATLIQSRKDWGEKPPVFANNPAVKGGKMPERREISPLWIIPIGIILGIAAGMGLVALARAAPPEVYTCPVCGDEFSTLEDLQDHLTSEHPGELIPAFTFSNEDAYLRSCPILELHETVIYSCTITNPTDKPLTRNLQIWQHRYSFAREKWLDPYPTNPKYVPAVQLTLNPGESYNFYHDGYGEIDGDEFCLPAISEGWKVIIFLQDEYGNRSEGVSVTRA